MKELRFRAWNGDMMSEPFAPWELKDNLCGGLMDSNGVSVWWQGYEFQWMQWTGLTDRFGCNVYEGDILRGEMLAGAGYSRKPGKPCLFEVVSSLHHGGYGFTLKQLTKLTGDYRGYPYVQHCTILGNIYERPSLLMEEP